AETLYRQPVDRFVASFIGRGTVLPAIALGLPGDGDVLVRPDRLLPDATGGIVADVMSIAFRGPGLVAQLRLRGGELVEAELPAGVVAAPGTMLTLRLVEDALVGFPSMRRVS